MADRNGTWDGAADEQGASTRPLPQVRSCRRHEGCLDPPLTARPWRHLRRRQAQGVVHRLEAAVSADKRAAHEGDEYSAELLGLRQPRPSLPRGQEAEGVAAVEKTGQPQPAEPRQPPLPLHCRNGGSEGHRATAGRGDADLEPPAHGQLAVDPRDERIPVGVLRGAAQLRPHDGDRCIDLGDDFDGLHHFTSDRRRVHSPATSGRTNHSPAETTSCSHCSESKAPLSRAASW